MSSVFIFRYRLDILLCLQKFVWGRQIQSTPRYCTTMKFSALRTKKPHRVDNVWT